MNVYKIFKEVELFNKNSKTTDKKIIYFQEYGLKEETYTTLKEFEHWYRIIKPSCLADAILYNNVDKVADDYYVLHIEDNTFIINIVRFN